MYALRFIIPLLTVFLSACAVKFADKDLSFSANSQYGMVAMLADPHISVLNFRAIQLPEKRIQGGYFNACELGAVCGERQLYNFANEKGKVFKIRPGTYVLQGYWTDQSITRMQKTHLCGGMIPFEVKAGEISIVGYPFASAQDLSGLTGKLKAIPSVTAPIFIKKPQLILQRAGWIKGQEGQDCDLDDGEVLEIVKRLSN